MAKGCLEEGEATDRQGYTDRQAYNHDTGMAGNG